MVPVAYNLRNLAVRKVTTIATAAGLGLVVFVFASALMLSNGLEQAMGKSGKDDRAIVMRKGADAELSSGIDEPQVGLVLASAEVHKGNDGAGIGVGELTVVILLDKEGTDGVSNVQVRGVPDTVMKFRTEVKMLEGRAPQPGSDEAIVGRAIRGRFKGLELGQSFELKKNRPLKVVGVFEDGGSSFESEVWTDLHNVRTAFGREGLVSAVRVQLISASSFEAFRTSIEQNRQLGLQVQRESAYYEKQSEGTSIFIKALGFIIAFFISLGAMIGAMITMYGTVAHRQREIGTLRALGFSRSAILVSFLFESVTLALLGGLVGVLAALPMGMVRFSTMNFATWSEIVFAFEPTPKILVSAVLLAVGMGVLGGFFPALRAARINPVKAMRG
jgi:putative ABC transport system permease protein